MRLALTKVYANLSRFFIRHLFVKMLYESRQLMMQGRQQFDAAALLLATILKVIEQANIYL